MSTITVYVQCNPDEPRIPLFAKPLMIAGLTGSNTPAVDSPLDNPDVDDKTLAEKVCLFLDKRRSAIERVEYLRKRRRTVR